MTLSSAARSVPTRTWSPSSRRAAQPAPAPTLRDSLVTRVIAKRAAGSRRQLECCPGPNADQHPVRAADCAPAGPNSPAPTARHGHHFRSRHPAASSPPAALRPPPGLGAPGLRGPGAPLPRYRTTGSAFDRLEFPPAGLEEEDGDPAGQAAAQGGGGTEKGVVDQVGGRGRGIYPPPRGAEPRAGVGREHAYLSRSECGLSPRGLRPGPAATAAAVAAALSAAASTSCFSPLRPPLSLRSLRAPGPGCPLSYSPLAGRPVAQP